MKVIKKNEVETSEYPKRIVCDHCGAELEYDKEVYDYLMESAK